MTKSLISKFILITSLSIISTSAIAMGKNTYLDFKTYDNQVPEDVTPETRVNPPSIPQSNPVPPTSNPIKASTINSDFGFPLSIPGEISSPFGWRINPFTGLSHLHEGVDFAVPVGTPVLAVANGEVAIAGNVNGYGLTVIMRHDQNTRESRYAHLSKILVKPGQQVTQGTVIGLAGNTGWSTGPHLHFEWRQLAQGNWIPTDPGTLLLQARTKMVKAQIEPPVVKPKLAFKPEEYSRAPRHLQSLVTQNQNVQNLPLNFALNIPNQISSLIRRRFFGLSNHLSHYR